MADARAAGPAPPTLLVTNAWSRATAPGATVGVAYFDVVDGGAADRLLAIESPHARHVEMHTTQLSGGMMQMRPTPSVSVPAGGRVAFAPNGLHAMLIDLDHPLVAGERIPLTLVFERAGRVQVEALVRGIDTAAAAAPPEADPGFRLAVWPQRDRRPDFALSDPAGVTRRAADFRGRVLVIFFGFVHCPDACPAELFKLSLVMKQLAAARSKVQVIFITLDPERDGGSSLRDYVAAYDPGFLGLTGTLAQVDRAAGNFSVEYARVPVGNGYTIDHSAATFILDATGRLRLVAAFDASVADFVHDLTALVAE